MSALENSVSGMDDTTLSIHLKTDSGQSIATPLSVPAHLPLDELAEIYRSLTDNDETPVTFFIGDDPITTTLQETHAKQKIQNENVIEIVCQKQATFRVRPVTRCTGSISGHTGNILAISFSPNGEQLASCSGDCTVRFWDIRTKTPSAVAYGHSACVYCVAWSPDSFRCATGCGNGEINVWDPKTGKTTTSTFNVKKRAFVNRKGKQSNGQRIDTFNANQRINSLCWKPFHLDSECRYLASASKNTTIGIYDTLKGAKICELSGHKMCVTFLRWSGSNLIYSSSQDQTVKVWDPETKTQIRSFNLHKLWVNRLALSSDYVLRLGAYEAGSLKKYFDESERDAVRAKAEQAYRKVCVNNIEWIVSSSDDQTMKLWSSDCETVSAMKTLAGNVAAVIDVKFSPDGRMIASASFDKTIRVWSVRSTNLIITFYGHVQRNYFVSWSSDSRLLASCSSDATVKVWSIAKKKLEQNLTSHRDEVFCLDWSPDGAHIASGGRDKLVKIWQH